MKLTRLLLISMGLTAGLASAAETETSDYTGTVWAQGVTQDSGWYDINKNAPYNGDTDDLMCFAACSTNLITWWQKSNYGRNLESSAPKDINDIWQKYEESNQVPDMGGKAPGEAHLVWNWGQASPCPLVPAASSPMER